jgi:hypothetical protein
MCEYRVYTTFIDQAYSDFGSFDWSLFSTAQELFYKEDYLAWWLLLCLLLWVLHWLMPTGREIFILFIFMFIVHFSWAQWKENYYSYYSNNKRVSSWGFKSWARLCEMTEHIVKLQISAGAQKGRDTLWTVLSTVTRPLEWLLGFD